MFKKKPNKKERRDGKKYVQKNQTGENNPPRREVNLKPPQSREWWEGRVT